MKLKSLLPLAFVLPMFASCGDAVEAASNGTEGLKEMAANGLDGLKDLDISGLSMDAVKEKGGEVVASLTEKLGSLKNVADVDKLKESMLPMLDKVVAMKDKLGASLPGTDALKGAMEKLTSQFSGDSGMMEALKPLLEKLKGLVG